MFGFPIVCKLLQDHSIHLFTTKLLVKAVHAINGDLKLTIFKFRPSYGFYPHVVLFFTNYCLYNCISVLLSIKYTSVIFFYSFF